MTDVLILGCGFTGRRIADRLRARGYTVQGTRRDTLNLENPGALAALRDMVTPGVGILHSIPTLPGDLDRLAVASLKGAARVVYLSTTGVYGDAEFVDETTPARPVAERAQARLRTEGAVLGGPWSSLVLRPAAIYGPGRIARYARSSAWVSRIHVDDLAAHAEAALFSEVTGAWPVADDHPCPTAEVLEFLGAGSAVPPPSARPVPTSRRVDGSAIRRELGIVLQYPSYREGSIEPTRIFLAEDNPADVYLVREAFRHHGLQCDLQTADDGEQAIDYIRAIGRASDCPPPSLLMLDLNLPRIDHGDLLQAYCDNTACAGIPLIVLSSANAADDLRAEGLLPPGSVFFRKPAELDAFLEIGALVKRMLASAME